MYCPNCGSEEQGQFCHNCGTRLNFGPIEEEQEILKEKKRKKLIIYGVTGVISVIFIIIILLLIGRNITNRLKAEQEEAAQKAAEKQLEEDERKEEALLTTEQKRNRYYFGILEEYQKAENGETLDEPDYVNEFYIKECDFNGQNPEIYVALLDLCGDESPELVITKYMKDNNSYKIIDMYEYENNMGRKLFEDINMGYGTNFYICENGKLKEEILNFDRLVKIAYYVLEKDQINPILEEQSYEKDQSYYYASADNPSSYLISKEEYEDFRYQYALLTGIKWNQLSLWERPDEY